MLSPDERLARRLWHSHWPVGPDKMTDENLKGPASYFPSIEKKYGQPIQHWLDITQGLQGLKHMEMVARLKTEHGLGHGHANAIVAYVLAQRA
jgi:hypothetical protein